MDFELSPDQQLLVDTVANFTRKESPVERFRRLRGTELGWERSVWKQMGELGWLGVLYPETVGGAGMSFQEAGLILEQFGTTLVPEPYLSSAVLAGSTLRSASAELQEEVLAPLVSGDRVLALAYVEAQSRDDLADVTTRATRQGSGFTLTGRKRWVLDGHAAEHFVVAARTAGGQRDREGITLFVVERDAPGVSVTRVECMDGHKAAMLELDRVSVGSSRVIGEVDAGLPVLERAVDLAAAGAACEGSGLLQSVLTMTRNYLVERKQFGVPIGSFQALQHRAVDMFVEVELMKSTAILAMIKGDSADTVERQRAVSTAKWQLSVGGGFVVRQGTQLHGGIGVTDEHDIGLYFKRHHVLSTLFGDEQAHVARTVSSPLFTANV